MVLNPLGDLKVGSNLEQNLTECRIIVNTG